MKDIRKIPVLFQEFFKQYNKTKKANKVENKMRKAIMNNNEENLKLNIEKFLEIYPTSPRNSYYPEKKWAANIYYNVGTTCAKEKKFDLAISMYRIAASYSPSPSVYNNMATCFKRQQKYYEAYNCLKKALKLDSNYTSGYGRMAILIEAYDVSVNDDAIFYLKKYFSSGGKKESLEKLVNTSIAEEKMALEKLKEKLIDKPAGES